MRLYSALALTLLALVTPVASAQAPDGRTADTPIPWTQPQSGLLPGNPDGSGSFAFYSFPYPGDESKVTITLNFSPSNPAAANAVGLNAWQNGKLVAQLNNNGPIPGTNKVDFSTSIAGTALVQVYNYNLNTAIGFTVSLIGLSMSTPVEQPAPAPAPTPAPEPAAAAPTLQPAGNFSGQIVGNSSGSFANSTFEYAGDQRVKRITLTFSPRSPAVANGVGLNAWQGDKLIASLKGSGPMPGTNWVDFSSAINGQVLVQVFNYNPRGEVAFEVSVT